MSNWVWSVTPENWPIVKSKKIWAINATKTKNSKMSKGDKIIFYVNGTMLFHGIYEIINDWHDVTTEWSNSNYVEYVSEIDLEEIQTGFASVKKLLGNIAFIENKKTVGAYLRGSTHGSANYGKPISDNDLNVILKELEQFQEIPLLDENNNTDVELIPVDDWDFIDKRIHNLSSPNLRTVDDIVSEIDRGRIAIPYFQRKFIWKRNQVEELWKSIFQGFFVGSILTWSSNESFPSDSVEGGPELDNPTDVVLDGQQRITSIYYAIAFPDITPRNMPPTRFFVDLNSLLNPNTSRADIVVSVYDKHVKRRGLLDRETQFKKKLFPIFQLYKKNYIDWCYQFRDYLEKNDGYTSDQAGDYHRHLQNILDQVWSKFQIPAIQLPKSMNLYSVAEIFEKINSEGTQLGIFDLLNAIFTRYEINLAKLWSQAKADYDNIALMDKEINKNGEKILLQAMCLYKKGYSKRKALLELDSAYTEFGEFQKDHFESDWEEICKFISRAIDKIMSRHELGFGAIKFDMIPYTVIIPILAALMYKISDRPDKPKCMRKIEIWYWAVVFSDSYSGSTDSNIEKDLREMKQWFDDESLVPHIIFSQRIRFDKMNFQSNRPNDSIYKAIMCMVSKKGTLDFVDDEYPKYDTIDDHHIFPKSKKDEYAGEISIDSVLNRVLISSGTNRNFIRNKKPSDYLNEIINTQGISKKNLQERFETHMISSDAFEFLLQDNFNGFVEERKKSIRAEYKRLIFPQRAQECNIDSLLHKNESQTLEYKSTMRWDIRENKQSSVMEEVIVKELCAFMNTDEGGHLLIGVNDDGNAIGLEKDYSTLRHQNADGFEQHLINLIRKHLGVISNSYVGLSIHTVDGMKICLCKVKHAPKPTYLTIRNEKLFYVRMNNTAQPMNIDDANRYISEHWD